MYAKVYAINEVKNEFERDRVIDGVTAERFAAAKEVGRLDAREHEGDMLADLHDEHGNIIDVAVFSRQMRDRVVAELKSKN